MALSIPGFIEALFQEVVSETSGLQKAIHDTNELDVYPSARHGFLWSLYSSMVSSGDVTEFEFGELGSFEWCMR